MIRRRADLSMGAFMLGIIAVAVLSGIPWLSDDQPRGSLIVIYAGLLICGGLLGIGGLIRGYRPVVFWAIVSIAIATATHGLVQWIDGDIPTGLRLMLTPLIMIPTAAAWRDLGMLDDHMRSPNA